MTLPTFVVIGAGKGGTVALYRYLRDHPEVFMSEIKELRFFVAERNWERGVEWYEEQFQAAGDAVAIGEASPIYTEYPQFDGVPERIAKVLPDVRLIYLVRHPIERLRSDYADRFLRGGEQRSPEVALASDPGYLNRSRYGMQVQRYLDYFPKEQLLLVKSEDLRGSRADALERIYSYIGVDEGWESSVLKREYHSTADWRLPRTSFGRIRASRPYRALSRFSPQFLKRAARPLITRRVGEIRPEIPDDLRHELEEVLREDVRLLREQVGGDYDGWGLG
jgi:Sulfotransferase domain